MIKTLEKPLTSKKAFVTLFVHVVEYESMILTVKTDTDCHLEVVQTDNKIRNYLTMFDYIANTEFEVKIPITRQYLRIFVKNTNNVDQTFLAITSIYKRKKDLFSNDSLYVSIDE